MTEPAKPPSETLTVLRSIDQSMKMLVAIAQRKALDRAREPAAKPALTVASDRDLDGKYGDPEVKFNPRDWTGEPIKGLHMSACPAEALDMLAEAFDSFAQKAEETNEVYNGKLVAPYKRIDAARCRGWAARIRAGKVTAPADDKGWADPKLYGDGL